LRDEGSNAVCFSPFPMGLEIRLAAIAPSREGWLLVEEAFRSRGGPEVSEMVKLAIDFENPSPKWWDGGGRDLWEAILEGFDNNSVVVDQGIADSWLVEAAKLPGWDGGSE
jgi:hypothetical protein